MQGASRQTGQEPFLPFNCLLTQLEKYFISKISFDHNILLKNLCQRPAAHGPNVTVWPERPLAWLLISFQLPLILHVWVKLVKSQLLFAPSYVTRSGGGRGSFSPPDTEILSSSKNEVSFMRHPASSSGRSSAPPFGSCTINLAHVLFHRSHPRTRTSSPTDEISTGDTRQ